VTWFLTQHPDPGKSKICRVFKASAKEKLASPQLEQLLANISDAARKVCEVKARAQGRPAAEAPIIEAHAGTGIVIVAGTESDVQLVGQVIQALGGEVVPLTSSVTWASGGIPLVMKDAEGRFVEFEGFTNYASPVVATGTEGTRLEVTGGTLVMPPTSSSIPVVTKDKEGKRTQLEVTGVTVGGSPSSSVPDATKAMEDTRKQLERARDQVKNLEKQLELLRQQQQPTPPKAK